MIHIWCEDSVNSAFVQFLSFLKYFKVSDKIAYAEIKGFDGNKKLCEYVEGYSYNKFDKYIIFFDNVWDNNSVLKYAKRIDKVCKRYNNVVRIELLSFEYLILKFKYIINWTSPIKNTKIYNKAQLARADFISCTENSIDWRKKDNIVQFIVDRKNLNIKNNQIYSILANISAENVCTDILSALTNVGPTDFGITKTRLGKCWINSCCFKFDKKVGNEKCRLYKYEKTSEDKAMNLWNCTDIHKFIK